MNHSPKFGPFILVSLVFTVGTAMNNSTSRPHFSDYKVSTIYKSKPAVPKLTKDQRTFRTMIRRGAANRVQFAGHYTVPLWGCGAGCSAFAVADSVSGVVYDGFGVADLPMSWLENHEELERIEFHPNSRLLKINGCPNESDCGFYDYVMEDGKGLKLVRKELLPASFQ